MQYENQEGVSNVVLLLKACSFGPKTRAEIKNIFDSDSMANSLTLLVRSGHLEPSYITMITKGHYQQVRQYSLTESGKARIRKTELKIGAIIQHPNFPRGEKQKEPKEKVEKKPTPPVVPTETEKNYFMVLKAIKTYPDRFKEEVEDIIQRRLDDKDYADFFNIATPTVETHDGVLSLTKLGLYVLGLHESEFGVVELPEPIEINLQTAMVLTAIETVKDISSHKTLVASAEELLGDRIPLVAIDLAGGYSITTAGKAALKKFKESNPTIRIELDSIDPEPVEPKPAAVKVEATPQPTEAPFVGAMEKLTDKIEHLAQSVSSITDVTARALRLAEVAFKSAEETALRINVVGFEERANTLLTKLEEAYGRFTDVGDSKGDAVSIRHILEESKIQLGEIEELKTTVLEAKAAIDKVRDDASIKFSQLQSMTDKGTNPAPLQAPGEIIPGKQATTSVTLPRVMIIGLKPIQSGTIVNEYSNKFEIVCWNMGDGHNKIKGLVKTLSLSVITFDLKGKQIETA